MRKQQQQKQQQSLKPPNQTLLAKKTPTASTSPHSFFPEVSDSSIFLSTRPLGPFQCAGNSTITESPTSDVQMQDPQLERLVASVPALYSDAYDIDQIRNCTVFLMRMRQTVLHSTLCISISHQQGPVGTEFFSQHLCQPSCRLISQANLVQHDKLELCSLQSKRQTGIPEALQYGGLSLIKVLTNQTLQKRIFLHLVYGCLS